MGWLVPVVACAIFCQSALAVGQYKPEQIHLAYGETVRNIVVVWNTKDAVQDSIVKYGIVSGKTGPRHEYAKNGTSERFVDQGKEKNAWYIHRALLDDLKPGKTYEYRVGSRYGWSDTYRFKTPPENLAEWSPNLAVYGDLGADKAISLPRLTNDTAAGMYDAILHVGDFAYDFYSDEGRTGDRFMRLIEPIAAYVPYMVCPGNHEEGQNFSHYIKRFSMPGPYDNLFYSIDIGPLHLVSLTTEVHYYSKPELRSLDAKQYAWLEKDLAEANKPENRKLRPWILTMGHRPMYCSNGDDNQICMRNEVPIIDNPVRVGVTPNTSLENLLYRYKVDVEVWAHEHTYERLWPIFNFTVYNGSKSEPYVDPKAPVHVITGSAGNVEGKDNFTNSKPDWSAFRSTDFGYTRLKIFNKTHLRFQQLSEEQNGKIIDEWWVVRKFPREPYPLNV